MIVLGYGIIPVGFYITGYIYWIVFYLSSSNCVCFFSSSMISFNNGFVCFCSSDFLRISLFNYWFDYWIAYSNVLFWRSLHFLSMYFSKWYPYVPKYLCAIYGIVRFLFSFICFYMFTSLVMFPYICAWSSFRLVRGLICSLISCYNFLSSMKSIWTWSLFSFSNLSYFSFSVSSNRPSTISLSILAVFSRGSTPIFIYYPILLNSVLVW